MKRILSLTAKSLFMRPAIAIVGRPNVGKSTLFNRLIGRRSALVDPTPGVTRDRREGDAQLGSLRFTAVDTAGLEDEADSGVEIEMRRRVERLKKPMLRYYCLTRVPVLRR